MKMHTTLLLASLTFTGAGFAADDGKTGNERAWSIGIGKTGVEVKEIEPSTSTTYSPQSTTGAGRTKWMGGKQYRPLEHDHRWHVGQAIKADVDVDLAYAQIKREFSFDTTDERLANTPAVRGHVSALYQAGFLYEASPGAYYKMRDRTRSTGNRIVQVEIYKHDVGTLINFGFAKAGLPNPNDYASQLESRILAAINR